MKTSTNTIKRVLGILLCIIMVLGTVVNGIVAVAVGTEIYVDSNTGSDSNAGTSAAPLKTVAAAKNKLGNAAGTIHFANGNYYIDSTISYTGGGSNTITYKADGNAVYFNGSYKVTDWTDATFNGKSCWSTNLSNSNQVMLYSESEPLQNSRMPNTGEFFLSAGADPLSSSATFANNRAVITKTSDTSALANYSYTSTNRSIIRIYHYWMEEPLVIESYDAATGKIVFDDAYSTPQTMCTSRENDPYYLENVPCGFDIAGEWYADYVNKKLYYIPKADETKASTNLYLATTETIFTINGVNNIHFEGINFRNTGWNYTGNLSQSAYASKSAIVAYNTSGIQFTNCTFTNIGATAVNFGNWDNGTTATTNCSITGCSFKNIGASAVAVTGTVANPASHITVSDNLMYNYGFTRRQATCLFVTRGNYITLENNEIHDGLYTGISVGWQWGYNPTYSSTNHHNVINNNLIYNIGHGNLSDMGGIYVLGVQANSEMKNNVVHDVCTGPYATTYGGWGLYTDEGSQGWTIQDNIVYDCGSQGFHQHYGYQNIVRNNIFAFNNEGQIRSSTCHIPTTDASADISGESKYFVDSANGTQFTLEKNILVGDNQSMYSNLNASYFTDTNNLYWDYSKGAAVVSVSSSNAELSVSTVRSNYGTNNYNKGKFANPNFVDKDNRNFNLSSALTVGTDNATFNPIDITDVGSSTYKSRYLLNDLAARENVYSPSLWQTWENAKEAAINNRTTATADALENAYLALSVMDSYSEYVIDFNRYYYGTEYDNYMTAYNAVVADFADDNNVTSGNVTNLQNAYNAITSTNYTITYAANNGSVSSASTAYNYNTYSGSNGGFTLPTATRSGYKFMGWLRSSDGEIIPAGTYYAGSGSYTLTAQWASAQTLNLYPNEGVWDRAEGWSYSGGAGLFEQTVGAGESLANYLNHTASRNGYYFVGWNTKQDGTGTDYTENSVMPSSDLTLYAKWQQYYTVYYDNKLADAYISGWGGTYFGYRTDLSHNEVDSITYDSVEKSFTINWDKNGSSHNCYGYITKAAIPVTSGHTYRISFDCDTTPRFLISFTNSQNEPSQGEGNGAYMEMAESSFTFQATTSYIGIRIGIHGVTNALSATYSHIILQDITGATTKNVPTEFMTQVMKGATGIPYLADIGQTGYVLSGWSTTEGSTNVSDINISTTTSISSDIKAWPVWSPSGTLCFDTPVDVTYLQSVDSFALGNTYTTSDVIRVGSSITFTVVNPSDAYLTLSSPIQLIGGHRYRFTYDYTSSGTNKATRYTLLTASSSNGNFYASPLTDGVTYVENMTNGQEFTVPSDRPYVALRLGASQSSHAGDVCTYDNIAIQDITDGNSTPVINGQATYYKAIATGSTYGTLPVETRPGYVFLGWYTAPDGQGGTKVSSSTVLSSNAVVHLWSHWLDENAESPITVNDSANACYTVVPETVYVKASDQRTFQYYINNTFSRVGGVESNSSGSRNNEISLDNTYATTGKFYFYNSEATQVAFSINLNSYTLTYTTTPGGSQTTYSGGFITLPSGYLEGKITAGVANSALGHAASNVFKWTFQYRTAKSEAYCQETSNGIKYAYAYTTMYSPNRNVTANGVFGFDYNSSESVASSLLWLQGLHKTAQATYSDQDDSGALGNTRFINYQNISGRMLDPLANGISNPDSKGNATEEWSSASSPFTGATKSFLADRSTKKKKIDGDGNWVITLDANRTPGEVFIDISRNSNLNQLPNLKLGYMVTDWQNSTGRRNWYVSDATSQVTNPNTPSTATFSRTSGGKTADLLKHSYWKNDNPSKNFYYDYCGTVLGVSEIESGKPTLSGDHASSNEDGSINDEGIKYWKIIDFSVSSGTGSETRYYRGACSGNKDSSWAISSAMVLLTINRVDKSALRSLVQEFSRLNYQPYWFYDKQGEGANTTSASWDTYMNTVFKNACLILGKPDATQTEVNNAYSALKEYRIVTASYDSLFNMFDWAKSLEGNRPKNQTSSDCMKYDIANDTITFTEDGSYNTLVPSTSDGYNNVFSNHNSASSYSIAVKPNTTYRFTYYVKKSGSSDPQTMVFGFSSTTNLTAQNFSGLSVSYKGYTSNDANSSTWTPVSYEFTTGSGCNCIQVRFGYHINAAGAATVQFKNPRIVPVSANSTVYPYTDTVVTPRDHNEFLPAYQNLVTKLHTAQDRTGFVFLGWYDTYNADHLTTASPSPAGNQYYVGYQLPTDSGNYKSIFLWSAWRASKYIIAYDANGGTGTISSEEVAYSATGGTHTLKTNTGLYRSGYEFVGWNTSADGTGISYSAGQTVPRTWSTVDGAVITLYAQWKKISTLAIDSNGGRTTNNLIYFQNGATTFTEGNTNSGNILWNGSYESDSDVRLTGTISAKSSERYPISRCLCVYLVEGHTYTITFKVNTNGNGCSDFYLANSNYSGINCRSGRLKGNPALVNGIYTVTAKFTVGAANTSCTNMAGDMTWNDSQYDGKLTAVYNFRMSYSGVSTELDYTISDFRIYEESENNGVDNYITQRSGDTRYIQDPYRAGYVFDGWTVKSGDGKMNGRVFTYGEQTTTITANWKPINTDDAYVIDYGKQVILPVTDNDNAVGTNVTLGTTSANCSNVSINYVSGSNAQSWATCNVDGKNGNTIKFVPGADFMSLNEPYTFYYKTTITDSNNLQNTRVAKVTIYPANNVYYEAEDICTFTGTWTLTASTGYSQYQTASALGSKNNYGYDSNIQDKSSINTYSNAHVKYATVSPSSSGMTASFTFRGTGFEVFSLSDSTVGAVKVTIKNNDTNKTKRYIDDAYSGYAYGKLYITSAGRITLTSTGNTALYTVKSNTPENVGYYVNSIQVVPAGNQYATTTQAQGWIVDSDGSQTQYQIPLISHMDLEYGSYTVTIAPYYNSTVYDHSGAGSYKFYLDAIRIYNPLGDDLAETSATGIAYLRDNEYDAQFINLREKLVGKKSFYDSGTGSSSGTSTITGSYSGIAYMEAIQKNVTVSDYAEAGPTNEIYLKSGSSITFNISDTNAPASIQLGMRSVTGNQENVTVTNGGKTSTFAVKGSTQQYRDLTGCITWTQSGGNYQSGTITITNTGSGVVALSKLKLTYSQRANASTASDVSLEVSSLDIENATIVLEELAEEKEKADISSADITWKNDVIDAYTNAVLNVETDNDIAALSLDGNQFTTHQELENGRLLWTYTFDVMDIGNYDFTIVATDTDGKISDPVLTDKLTVVAPVVSLDELDASFDSDTTEVGDTAHFVVSTGLNIASVVLDGKKYSEYTEDANVRTFIIPIVPDEVGTKTVSYYLTDINGYNSILQSASINVTKATINTEGISAHWQSDTIILGETAVLYITANDSIVNITVDGQKVVGNAIVLKPTNVGTCKYKVVLTNAKGVSAEFVTDELTVQPYTASTQGITTQWSSTNLLTGEKATLSITTPGNIQSVTINGETIYNAVVNENGTKSWSYTYAAVEEGNKEFEMKVTDDYGMDSDVQSVGVLTITKGEIPEKEDTQLTFWQKLVKAVENIFTKIANVFSWR